MFRPKATDRKFAPLGAEIATITQCHSGRHWHTVSPGLLVSLSGGERSEVTKLSPSSAVAPRFRRRYRSARRTSRSGSLSRDASPAVDGRVVRCLPLQPPQKFLF